MLATTRVGAFAVASPQLGAAIPTPAKLALTTAVGFFLVAPVTGELTLARIVAMAVVNAGMGMVMGWLLGALFHMFAVAGTIIDATAGTSIASIVDPTQASRGRPSAACSRSAAWRCSTPSGD